MIRLSYLSLIILYAILISPLQTFAAPTGGNVVAGDANISNTGKNTVVNQHTDKAIINWDKFNIGSDESVRFNQLNSNSVVLNRVNGGTRSEIFGNLSANGKVFILNSNGILIGNGANVNVGSFLASTGQISDKDFLNGKFNINSANGEILNQGVINVHNGGYAALLSRRVVNEGVISAYLGRVDIASGDSFRLNFYDNKLIGIDIDKGTAEGYINNSGRIEAEGGTVFIAAKGLSSLLESTVNNDGIIKAGSMLGHGGRVIIVGSNATVNNNGLIDVSASLNGGSVSITSDVVNLNGEINASGDRGGIIFVDSAKETNINSGAKISADGINQDGGNIKLLSRDITRFISGSLVTAKSVYGKGGFFELSAIRKLIIEGKVDLKSNYNKGGHLYIDPMNITISAAGGTAGQNITYITLADLQDLLSGGSDVTIATTEVGSGVGDIVYNGSGFGLLSGGILTLSAANSIVITNPNMDLAGLSLEAGRDITIRNDTATTNGIKLGADGFVATLYGVLLSDVSLSTDSINVNNIGTNVTIKQILSLNTTNTTSLDITTGNKIDISTINNPTPTPTTAYGFTVVNLTAKEIALTASGDVSNRVDAGTLSSTILDINARGIDLINIDVKDLSATAERALFISNDSLSNVVARYLGAGDSYSLIYEQTNGGLLTINDIKIKNNASQLRLSNASGYIEMPFQGIYDKIVGNSTAVTVTSIGTTLIQKVNIGDILVTSDLSRKIRVSLTVLYEADGGNIVIENGFYRPSDGLVLKARGGSISSVGAVGFLSLHAEARDDIDISHTYASTTPGLLGELPTFSGISTTGSVNVLTLNVPLKILTLKSAKDSNITFNSADSVGVYMSNIDVAGNLNLNIGGTTQTTVAISGVGENALKLNITAAPTVVTALNILTNKNLSVSGMAILQSLVTANLTSLTGEIRLDTDSITATRSVAIRGDKYVSSTGSRLSVTVGAGTTASPGTIYLNLNNSEVNVTSPVGDFNGNGLNVFLKDEIFLRDVNNDKTSLSGNVTLSTQDGQVADVILDSSAVLNSLTTDITNFTIGTGENATETFLTVKNLKAVVVGSISGEGVINADRADIRAAQIGGPDFNPGGGAPLDYLILNAKTARLEISSGAVSPTTRTIFLKTSNAFESLFTYEFITGGEAWIIDDIKNRAMLVNKSYYLLLNKTRESYLYPTRLLADLADSSLYDSLLQIGGDMLTSDIRYPRFVSTLNKIKTKVEIK